MKNLAAAHASLQRCTRLLVISGAGISTESGIGDYRDENRQWKRASPVMHQDFVDKLEARQRYWARSQRGYPQFAAAQPNRAHELLAAWETAGRVLGVITQNVDRLHQRAGQRNVIDLHGRLDRVVCLACGERTEREAVQTWLEAQNPDVQEDFYAPTADGDAELDRLDFSGVQVPRCSCGGTLKPDVVFFGDSVPRPVVDKAYAWVAEADGLLVVGSSLSVFSSFRFVRRAAELGIPLVAVNRGQTRADELFAAKLECGCSEGLAALNGTLGY